MQLILSAGTIAAIVVWGLLSPASLGGVLRRRAGRHHAKHGLALPVGGAGAGRVVRLPRLQPLRQPAARRRRREARVLDRQPGSRCCSPPAWASGWCSGASPSRCRTTRAPPPGIAASTPRRRTRRCATASSTGGCIRGRSTRSSRWHRLLPVPAPGGRRWSAPRPRRCPGGRCKRLSPLFDVLAVDRHRIRRGRVAGHRRAADQQRAEHRVRPAGRRCVAGRHHRRDDRAVPDLGRHRCRTRHQVAVELQPRARRRC